MSVLNLRKKELENQNHVQKNKPKEEGLQRKLLVLERERDDKLTLLFYLHLIRTVNETRSDLIRSSGI
ncbi:MAG: hypothetical protein YK1309IOTA_1420004 [Marine Group I thaumarchaeote]|nr:MAG: hypothetical protein YK1309IOTA_1420004 [Marine Group I thaumarchaeote]